MYIGTIRGWAIGLLHLSPAEFYAMRVGEFWEAMNAYWTEKKLDRQHIGELVRGAAVRLFNTQVEHPVSKIEKFWPMPWDDAADAEEQELRRLNGLTPEERQKEVDLFLERIKGNGRTIDKS